MANDNLKTKLGSAGKGTFQSMMKDGFGIVTVMNAYICDAIATEDLKNLSAYDVAYQNYEVGSTLTFGNSNVDVLCRLDTLKIANVTQEGPSKTVTGGQYSNPLIKFGKSARLEMQDALGNAAAIEALCGGIREWNGEMVDDSLSGLHFGEDFVGPKMIIGDSFFIDRKSGQQVKVKIVFYQFLPDSIFNLTQDAEGDATVFDMNGDLLTSEVLIGRETGAPAPHGVFYSIVEDKASLENVPSYEIDATTGVVTLKNCSATLDGTTVTTGTTKFEKSDSVVGKLVLTGTGEAEGIKVTSVVPYTIKQ